MDSPQNPLESYRRELASYGSRHVPPEHRDRVLGGVSLDGVTNEMESTKDGLVETPYQLNEMFPLTPEAELSVVNDRIEISEILRGEDPRFLVVMGPCSLDSSVLSDGTPAPIKTAQTINEFAENEFIGLSAKVIGRFPPRKPRTDTGHAGLQQKDRKLAHKLLSKIRNLGTSITIEMMQDHDFAYYKHFLSMGWIGARDSGSTVLRHEVSNNPELPILFKTGEDGTLDKALQSILTARLSHPVEYRDQEGVLRSRTSEGNPNLGIILRGGTTIKTPGDLRDLIFQAEAAKVPYLIDCAHGIGTIFDPKGKKSVQGQIGSLDFIASLIKETDPKDLKYLRGIMVEAYLVEGNNGKEGEQVPGRSATDPCITMESATEKIRNILEARESKNRKNIQAVAV